MRKELITTIMEIDDGTPLFIEGYVHYIIDDAYGSDADGNRAVISTIIKDVTDVCAYFHNDLFPLTPENEEKAVDLIIDAFREERE